MTEQPFLPTSDQHECDEVHEAPGKISKNLGLQGWLRKAVARTGVGCDIWIPGMPSASESRVKEDRAIWLPSVGSFRVNISCGQATTSKGISITIDNVRRIRIGGDGRYPAPVIWIEPSDTAAHLMTTVSEVDKSVPRIKVIIVAYAETACTNALRTLSDALKLRLDSRILFVLQGAAKDGGLDCLGLLRDVRLAQSLTYEWFPSVEGGNWSDCDALIEQLGELGYCFNLHPLSLCGGVAHFARANFLARFGISLPPNEQHRVNAVDLPSGGPFMHCAFDTVDHVLGGRLSNIGLSCCCKLPATIPDSFVSLSQSYSIIPTSPDDEILFEDWQYIYDGFDLA